MTRAQRAVAVAIVGLLPGCDRFRDALDSLREGSGTTHVETVDVPLPVFEFVDSTDEQLELYSAALDALAAGRSSDAVTILITLGATAEPSDSRAAGVLLLSDIYFNEGRYADCLERLDALATTSPPAAALEFLRGRTLIELDRDAEAEEALRRAMRLDVDFLRSYAVLAVMLADNGRVDEAAGTMLLHDRAVARIAARLTAGQPLEDRLDAVTALHRGWRDDTVSRALEPALADPSFEVRAATLDAFADVGTALSLGALEAHGETVDEALRERLDAAIAAIHAAAGTSPAPADPND